LPDVSFQQEGHVNQAAEYRTNAEICRRMADKAKTEEDKRAWLDMAQSWSFLTKLEDVVPVERADASERRTNQFNIITRNRYSEPLLTVVRIVDRLRPKLNSAYSSVSRLLRSTRQRAK
jgi:hypothetical protein